MQETWVQSLGQEDPLEKKMATLSSILAWKIPWTEKPNRLQSTGSQRVGRDWLASLPQAKGQTCGSYDAETGPSLSANLEQVDQLSKNDGNPSLPTIKFFPWFYFPPPSPPPSSFVGFCLFLSQVSSLPIDSNTYTINSFCLGPLSFCCLQPEHPGQLICSSIFPQGPQRQLRNPGPGDSHDEAFFSCIGMASPQWAPLLRIPTNLPNLASPSPSHQHPWSLLADGPSGQPVFLRLLLLVEWPLPCRGTTCPTALFTWIPEGNNCAPCLPALPTPLSGSLAHLTFCYSHIRRLP